MLLICTRMLFVFTRMYSYVLVCTRMLLVCARMLLVYTRVVYSYGGHDPIIITFTPIQIWFSHGKQRYSALLHDYRLVQGASN